MRLVAAALMCVFLAGCGETPARPSREPSPGSWPGVSLVTQASTAMSWQTFAAMRRASAVADAVSAVAPVTLTASVSGSTVTLTWTAAAAQGVLGYVIEAGSRAGLSDLATFDSGGAAIVFTATSVPAGTYFVRVRARTAEGISAASNEVTLTVVSTGCASAPGAPSGFTATVTGSTVTLQWTAPSSGCAATGYTIEAGSSPGASNLSSVPTGTTATTFAASGVGNGTYYVRVRATNAFGASAPSNETTLTVGASTSAFTVDLPIAAGDAATNAFGIWPFGVHGSVHSADGHPGFDIEYRPGATVYAAADGEVGNAIAVADGGYTVRLFHQVAGASYATDYSTVATLAPGIVRGARVARGQAIGTAFVLTQFMGSSLVTWGMVHFQVNDFSKNEGLTNQNAVSPELYLTPAARAMFDTLWQTAAYNSEWCEPFSTSSRLATFPVTRTWTLRSGSAPALIEIQCITASTNEMAYTLRNADRSVIESGRFNLEPTAKPLSTLTMTPASGSPRLGVWNIVSDTLQVNLGAPDASRPSTLSGAAVYTTAR